MDIPQTSVAKGKDEPAKKDDQVDQPTGGYYYDDTTGYEIYDDDDEPEEEDGDNAESQHTDGTATLAAAQSSLSVATLHRERSLPRWRGSDCALSN